MSNSGPFATCLRTLDYVDSPSTTELADHSSLDSSPPGRDAKRPSTSYSPSPLAETNIQASVTGEACSLKRNPGDQVAYALLTDSRDLIERL